MMLTELTDAIEQGELIGPAGREKLQPTEARLLGILVENQGSFVKDLCRRLYFGAGKFPPSGPANNASVHICHLRKKLARVGLPLRIETRVGFGYRLVSRERAAA